MKKVIPFFIAVLLLATGCEKSKAELRQLESSLSSEATTQISSEQPDKSYTTDDHQTEQPSTSETTDALDNVFFPLEVKVTVVNSHDYFEPSEQPDDCNKVFHSYDELQDFIENVVAPNYINGVPGQFYTYDEEFFKDKLLCYTTITSGTGSMKFFTDEVAAVKTQETDGIYVVDIWVPNKTPEVATCDMAYFCVFAELDKDDLADVSDENINLMKMRATAGGSQQENFDMISLSYDNVEGIYKGMQMNGTVTSYYFSEETAGHYVIKVERTYYGEVSDTESLRYACTEKDWRKLQSIVDKYDVESWNGFEQINMTQIADDNFELDMTWNGKIIHASGYASFPDDFRKLVSEIDRWLGGLELK